MRPDVIELLTMYEGPNPSEAFKFKIVENPPRPRDHRDNSWITEDPANGRWLVFRSQVPDRLEPAYDIALAAGLLEYHILSPESQLQAYQNAGLPTPEQNPRWTIFPANVDALVVITDQGRAALAEHRVSAVDDSNWPTLAEVQRGLSLEHRMLPGRLIADGELRDNGKTGKARRVDPTSILDYCKRHGVDWSGEIIKGVTDS